tara:strand:- start:119 stop:295 length:177 start_codon:yes stop_codon:yes gene_type:complete
MPSLLKYFFQIKDAHSLKLWVFLFPTVCPKGTTIPPAPQSLTTALWMKTKETQQAFSA